MWRVMCTCGMRADAETKEKARAVAEEHCHYSGHWGRAFFWQKSGATSRFIPVFHVLEWGTATVGISRVKKSLHYVRGVA